MTTKKEIRQQIIKQRKCMSAVEQIAKSSLICNKILTNSCYIKSKVVYVYCSVNREVSLEILIQDALKNNKIVAFPKVEGDDIFFYSVLSPEELKPGFFNIPEPVAAAPAPKGDLVLVPGVAFTKKGERLGYGGGFYDRFLTKNEIYSIGVGYDFQIVEMLPMEKHDRILNEIIYN